MRSAAAVLARVSAWTPDVAVVFGSGLEALPPGATVDDELTYAALGWPCTAVPGHGNRLRLARVPVAGGATLRLALASGRPHGYEGWGRADLERSVSDLAAAGVGRVLLTNSCGGLRPGIEVGAIVSCVEVVDLQTAPATDVPPRLPVCSADEAGAVAASSATVDAHVGSYVAVAGPQFETAAEVRWLAGYGDVVGMSAAPEVRAARAAGAGCCLLALVVNRAAAVGSHEDVLACAGRLAARLSAGLAAIVQARWPELA